MSETNFMWRRPTGWWDDLEVTEKVNRDYPSVFAWLDEVAPEDEEHDFVLYTDGSGCTKGWGGYASLIRKVELPAGEEFRRLTDSQCIAAGTYGSTVQRCEMNAFLDGVHAILKWRAVDEVEALTEEEKYGVSQSGILNRFAGPERITIKWYTDRSNLAKALLYDEHGEPLNRRNTEMDLWSRWSSMARFVCVTPMHISRNSEEGQAATDALAGLARDAMKASAENMAAAVAKHQQPEISWDQQKQQKAVF